MRRLCEETRPVDAGAAPEAAAEKETAQAGGAARVIYLVAAQTVVLILLAVLVAGLLRSHAETLRRLPAEAEDGEDELGDETPELQIVSPPGRELDDFPATDVAGATLAGDSVKVSLTAGAPHTLLAFLSSGCLTCANFWDALRPEVREPLPGNARPLIVTKDRAFESPSKLRELAPDDIPVVMSSTAWEDYAVPVAPYFVYVGEKGQVLGEGAAESWDQITSLFRDALLDLEESEHGRGGGAENRAGPTSAGSGHGRRRPRAGERLDAEDEALAAAGVRPGHPSLYPAEERDGPGDRRRRR